MSVLHKNIKNKVQSTYDGKSMKKENDFSTQPMKGETDTLIQDNILQTTKNSSLSSKNKSISTISSIERGKKAYKCPVCEEKFSSKGSLNQHISFVAYTTLTIKYSTTFKTN